MNPRIKCAQIFSNIDQLREELIDMIIDQLSHPAKDYQIRYKNTHYHFYPAFDEFERFEMRKDMFKLASNMVRDAFKASVSGNKKIQRIAWKGIEGIIGGENPDDYQFVKYDDVQVDPVLNEKGEVVRAIALNEDNYQVKENLGLLAEQRESRLQEVLEDVYLEVEEELHGDKQN